MSFSSRAKAELCRVPIKRRCCAVAEAYGALLYCSVFSTREIRIVTANDDFVERLPRLFRRAFSLDFDERPAEGARVAAMARAEREPDEKEEAGTGKTPEEE